MALSPTANQGARPNPAYQNAAHARMSRNASPQSGDDIGGPKSFLKGKGIPTSGGRAESGQGSVDRTHDQGGKRLYLGKAYENAKHAVGHNVKGNSEGRAEISTKTTSGEHVKKAADGRVSRNAKDAQDNERLAKGSRQGFTGQPFRKSSPAFGPLGKNGSAARGHAEHEVAGKF